MEDDVYNTYHPEEVFEYETTSESGSDDETEDDESDDDTDDTGDASDTESTVSDVSEQQPEMVLPDVSVFKDRLERKGYNMLDIISLFMDELSVTQTKAHYRQLKKDYDEVYNEVCNEYEENYFFGMEDKTALHMEVVERQIPATQCMCSVP